MMKKPLLLALALVALAGVGLALWRSGYLSPRAAPGGQSPGAGPGAVSSGAPGGASSQGAAGTGSPAVNAGAAAATGPAGQAPQAADASSDTGLPPFDGNIAAHEWGGRMESVTGMQGEDYMSLSRPLRGFESGAGTADPKEFVVSFWGREPALVDRVDIVATENASPQVAVEVWTSMTGPAGGFTRVAAETLPGPQTSTITFAPVEARFVKVRILGEQFNINWLKVFEAQRPGYVPLFARRPDVFGPLTGGKVPEKPPLALPACQPGPAAPMRPGRGQSRKVLLVSDEWEASRDKKRFHWLRLKHEDPEERARRSADLAVADGVEFDVLVTSMARPYHLSDALGYDTVILEQVSTLDNIPLVTSFRTALLPWVAAGHKLIIQDADRGGSPDYRWLPYRFRSSNPGAQGAPGDTLRILEDNWMVHNRRGIPGFIDTAAWERDDREQGYLNELGDTNTINEWDAHWCGHIVVRNTLGIFGFGAAYAHYGRGLILYNGFDVDMAGTVGYDVLIARELAQGFDPDNLPCSARMGGFVVTTDARLLYRPLAPGRSVAYPLTLLSNQNYRGTVTLSAASSPAVNGMQARFEPATVAVSGMHQTGLTLTFPADGVPRSVAVEVKGAAADGQTNTLCLQLGPPMGGELSVLSALSPPSKTGKNLEVILDASGSMKTLMGKKSRWDTALATLHEVLGRLPDDFNVGLRIYGHRESSTSAKTCTDSELLVPIQPLDRQAILNAAGGFKPKGETPLVYSARQAPDDLKALGGGTVILITDGGESCKGDAVKAAADLKASGLDIRLNIVGFGVTDASVQKALAGFAQAGGGRFYPAQSGQALADVLLIAAIEKFPYAVFDMAGKQVASGEAGGPADELPPGDYKVVVKAGARELVAPKVHVGLGQQTTLKIWLKGDQLVLE